MTAPWILATMAVLVIAGSVEAQPNDPVPSLLGRAAEAARTGAAQGTELATLRRADPKVVLKTTAPYEKDPSPEVRHLAYTLTWEAGRRGDAAVRQQALERQLDAVADPSPLVSQHAAKRVLDFPADAFTDKSKAALRTRLAEPAPRREIVLAAGLAGLRDELPRLEALLIDESAYERGPHSGRWYGTSGWAARLARARLGVDADTARAIELVEAEPDVVTRVTLLLKDLGYTRQPAALTKVREYLDSDERLPSTKPTAPGTPYAQYAIDVLAQYVDDFPVGRREPGLYSENQITAARDWMRAPGRGTGALR
jgi:hypothetical protein